MSKYDPSQGGRMADAASQASLHAVEMTRNADTPATREAAATNVELAADMAARAADQLKAEGR